MLPTGSVIVRKYQSIMYMVPTKSADVTSDHWNLEDCCKVEHPSDRKSILFPKADIISEPFSNMSTGTCKCRASDDKRALPRPTSQQCQACGGRHHRTIEIVCVVFLKAIGMDRTRLAHDKHH